MGEITSESRGKWYSGNHRGTVSYRSLDAAVVAEFSTASARFVANLVL